MSLFGASQLSSLAVELVFVRERRTRLRPTLAQASQASAPSGQLAASTARGNLVTDADAPGGEAAGDLADVTVKLHRTSTAGWPPGRGPR